MRQENDSDEYPELLYGHNTMLMRDYDDSM